MSAALSVSPANYLATFLIEEFGFINAPQNKIDILEHELNDAAAASKISLDSIPEPAEIASLFTSVQTAVNLDEIFLT